MKTVRKKFDTLLEISETNTPNDDYGNVITAHVEPAAKCILTKPGVEWVTNT